MATVQYMNVKTAALQWGLTERRVRILCSEGRVDGVIRNGWAWNIPAGTPKPQDGRTLRHIKNTNMRPGAVNYKELDALRERLAEMERDPDEVWSAVRSQIPRLVSGALAFDRVVVSATDIEALYRGKLVPSLSFEETLLALNCRTILLRTLAVTGLGPIERGAVDTPFLSEQKLRLLERDLLAGIDDTPSLRYRDASLPAGGSDDDKVFTIAAQMAILMMQYEKEWQMLHPLVRASFLFGELIRLCPFGGHDGLFALLAMDMELLAFGYPPAIIASDQCEEVRADLALTSGHGNYQRLIGFFEHSLIGSLKEMEG